MHVMPRLIVDSLAAFRLSRLVVADTLLDAPRAAVLDRLEASGPAGQKAAEGLGCYWCVGVWAAALVALLRRTVPALVDALAVAAGAGIIAELVEAP